MPENNKNSSDQTENDDDFPTMHTCACGEQHRHRPGSRSHRDECTSPQKFGENCCCGTGPAAMRHRNACGHGPRCTE